MSRCAVSQSAAFWSRFEPRQLTEIRALRKGSPAYRRWLRAGEFGALVPELERLNLRGYEIYVGVNPRAASGESGGDAVVEVVAFHADIDGDLCRRFPASVPSPTVLINSGHGFHVYWFLRKPVPVSDANREALKAINRGLALALGGDVSCHDLARILRVPGFTNHKPPVAEVSVVKADSVRRYRLSDFRHFVRVGRASDGGQVQSIQPRVIRPARLTRELQARFEELRCQDSVLRYAWRGEYGDGSSDSRYVAIRQLVASARFRPDEIVALVVNRRWYNRRSRQVRPAEHVFDDALRIVAKLRRSRLEPSGHPASLVLRRITNSE